MVNNDNYSARLGHNEQERSERADLCHASLIPVLTKPTISTDIAFSPSISYFLPIVIRITPNLFFTDPDSDPDHSPNLITCSLSNVGHILKIASKSVLKFLSYLSLKISCHGSRRSRY